MRAFSDRDRLAARWVAVTIFSDFTCPFSYVTETALRKRAAAGDVKIEYRAFELYPAPAPIPAPGVPREWEAAARPLARALGLDLHAPSLQPRTRKAHEAALFARGRDAGEAMRAAIYEAYWEAGRDIGRIDVLVEAGRAVGLDATELKIALDIDRYADAVLRDRIMAPQAGIESVPTLIVGAGPTAQLLVGAQSHDDLDAAIGTPSPRPSPPR